MPEGLIGAMIGAAAAIFGGLLGEMLKYHYSMAKMNIEKKREAYIEAMKYCLTPVVPATEISEESENNDTAAPSPLLIERFLSIYDWRDIIEVQRTNTPKVIESKKEQGGVCNAQI